MHFYIYFGCMNIVGYALLLQLLVERIWLDHCCFIDLSEVDTVG